ncbi:hypothetical protein BDFB_006802 [Asbolus verrucosus]|uniref:Uncharacterized protein n=1 Tax=Asbolus verrucosus TaxID=1661398 RepID=A0A482VZU8_ASBVE|nr:hypothetical protein BDFB_006802 [Asbolus verrucosus]
MFIAESYLRNGHLVDGVWHYSKFKPVLLNSANNFLIQLDRLIVKNSDRPKKRTDQVMENVRQIMEEALQISVHRLSQQVELSPATCRNILNKNIHLYPYRLQVVHQLREVDLPVHVEYYQRHDYEIVDGYFNKTVPLHTLHIRP